MEEQGQKKEKHASPKTPPVDDAEHGISKRILDSASGLLSDSFSSTGMQPAPTLANVIANEGKAGSSTAPAPTGLGTTSKLSEGLKTRNDASNTFREPARAYGTTSLRSSNIDEGLSLDQFLGRAQDEIEVPTWQHSPSTKGKQVASSLNGDHAEPPALDTEMSAAWNAVARDYSSQAVVRNRDMETRGTTGTHRVANIIEADGADVVKLLQDPSASFWTDMPDEDAIPYSLSEADMRVAEDLVRRLDDAMASKPGYASGISAAIHGRAFTSFSNFFDEIENYHDEVWGYLRPLVEEAKKEAAVAGSSVVEDGPATRRLRMILAHVGGSR